MTLSLQLTVVLALRVRVSPVTPMLELRLLLFCLRQSERLQSLLVTAGTLFKLCIIRVRALWRVTRLVRPVRVTVRMVPLILELSSRLVVVSQV